MGRRQEGEFISHEHNAQTFYCRKRVARETDERQQTNKGGGGMDVWEKERERQPTETEGVTVGSRQSSKRQEVCGLVCWLRPTRK